VLWRNPHRPGSTSRRLAGRRHDGFRHQELAVGPRNRVPRGLPAPDGGADGSIRIATPYFLPDRALRRALVEIARRGVQITVIVPGRITDQRWVRYASRRMWGQLLHAGVRLFEYRHTMTHAKVLIVDEVWAVLGTTNIDNRSFEHNDEVNLAMRDPAVAARLLEDFEQDLRDSEEVTLEQWQRRPVWEKIVGPFVWILERQQ
jgi:cardiolipin synthase A/B